MSMNLLAAAWRDTVRACRQVRTEREPRQPHRAPFLAKPTESVNADPREARLNDAHSMAAVHVPGADGWCVGCADLGRYALAPCPAARQALSLVETHGVAVWDARPAGGAGGERGGASLTPLDGCGASPLSRAAV
ncbi:MAG: hypothetical protein QOE61_796 [Micromonosporaceae bacterium]|nr:hypothetical protein [Micromonosporaceae bacterium]